MSIDSCSTHTVPIGLKTQPYGAGPSTQPILIRDVECIGSESKISECAHSDINEFDNCLHADDAGVICEGERERDMQAVFMTISNGCIFCSSSSR